MAWGLIRHSDNSAFYRPTFRCRSHEIAFTKLRIFQIVQHPKLPKTSQNVVLNMITVKIWNFSHTSLRSVQLHSSRNVV